MNADLTKPAVVHTEDLPWTPSPSPGVERRRIERNGGEVARLTSIVRYAPGCRFPTHVHGGGEEYLVLEGVFSDETGHHPAGTYVRNGVGTSHAPFSEEGCTILVRLWWMNPSETTVRKVNTLDASLWERGELRLHEGPLERVRLVDVDGAGELSADGGLEVMVLSGGFEGAPLGTWIRRADGELRLLGSGRILVRQGHLRRPPPLPIVA